MPECLELGFVIGIREWRARRNVLFPLPVCIVIAPRRELIRVDETDRSASAPRHFLSLQVTEPKREGVGEG